LHRGPGVRAGPPVVKPVAVKVDPWRSPIPQWVSGHGAGPSLSSYHFDLAGAVVEYYALCQVWDERTHEPGRWSLKEGRFASLWGPDGPPEMMDTAIQLPVS
jgi:hypothetical protein